MIRFSSVQSLSRVRLFMTPWTAARQASLSITNSQSLLKLMSIESVMPSNHLILCCPLLLCTRSFPASGSFQITQFFASGGQSIAVSASASVLPMNIQDWFNSGWTGWISLQSKGLNSFLQHHSSKASILRHLYAHNTLFILESLTSWILLFSRIVGPIPGRYQEMPVCILVNSNVSILAHQL